jgi:hypothetical protein
MGVAEAPVSNQAPEQAAPTPTPAPVAQASSSASTAPAQSEVAILEAKLKEALQAVHNRIGQVETFLKSKYPYSGL